MSSQTELSRELRWRPLTRTLIMRFKARSLRQGQWFKVLENQERGLVNATLLWVKRVRSERLERILTRILSKLAVAIGSPLTSLHERGLRMATRISELAVGWGNVSAWTWRFDNSFQAYLGAGLVGHLLPKMPRQSSKPISRVP